MESIGEESESIGEELGSGGRAFGIVLRREEPDRNSAAGFGAPSGGIHMEWHYGVKQNSAIGGKAVGDVSRLPANLRRLCQEKRIAYGLLGHQKSSDAEF
jgi:hypothetical protein